MEALRPSVGAMSHPMWVRGLKLQDFDRYFNLFHVAPYVGAWIETGLDVQNRFPTVSHPMWVRGLKLTVDGELREHCRCRTLCGCVD